MTTRPVLLERFGLDAAEPVERTDREAPDPVEPPEAPEPAAPPEPPFDPEAERREQLARIAAALEAVAADQAALRAQWIAEAAALLGAAAAEMAPRLARAGLAAHVAETVETVTRQGRWPRLELRAAPDDAREIGETVRGDMAAGIEISPDPSLAPGSVRLAWEGGGAEIDAEAIAGAALERLRRALSHPTMEPER